MSKSTSKTHLFILENPDTGEAHDFWMDIEFNYEEAKYNFDNGDPGEPGSENKEITNWGKTLDDEKPLWVTRTMLNKELSFVENGELNFPED